jgi:phenylalanine-4-hydroxylase
VDPQAEQLDYLSEPDLFHDLFGHVPLLMNPVFADYMAAYGRGGVKAHGIGPTRWSISRACTGTRWNSG